MLIFLYVGSKVLLEHVDKAYSRSMRTEYVGTEPV